MTKGLSDKQIITVPVRLDQLVFSRPHAQHATRKTFGRLETIDGKVIFSGYIPDDEAARRIVACWNYFDTLATGFIEAANEYEDTVTEILRRDRDALQARIDELMLEYCPDEMTKAQKATWAESQGPVSAEEAAAIDRAMKS